MQGGDRKRIAQTHIVKLIKFRRFCTRAIALLDCEHNRLARAAQHRCYLLIGCGHTAVQIRHQNNDICRLNGCFRLHAHEFQDFTVRARLNAAGINDLKSASAPFGVRIQPVTGDTRRVLYNREALTGKAVKQLRLADVRTADNRYNWFCHCNTPFRLPHAARTRGI